MTLSGGLSRPGERDRPIIKFMEIDWTFCLLLCLIAGSGALMLFSIAGASWEPWADKHLLRFGLYFIMMIILAMIDLRVWFTLAYPVYGVGLLLLVAVELIGDVSLGAQRWLSIGGFRFQPSEIMKIGVVLALARYYHGLSAADRHRILALGDQRLARFAHHAQVAFFQLEAQLLRLPRLQADALEPAQRAQGRTRHVREAQVKLHHLIAFALAGVGDGRLH